MLVEFASIVDAMRFAIAWQQDMAERPLLADTRIDFHIGDRVNLTSKQQN